MYYVWEDDVHTPLERSKLAQALMQTYLPGWTAELLETARLPWDLTRRFAWRLTYPDISSQFAVVQIAEEEISVAPVVSALHHEAERITLRLLERLHEAAESLADVLPGRGWLKKDGIWLSPDAVQHLERRLDTERGVPQPGEPRWRRWAALPLTSGRWVSSPTEA